MSVSGLQEGIIELTPSANPKEKHEELSLSEAPIKLRLNCMNGFLLI